MKTIEELREAKPTIEIDDVHIAAAMVDEIRGSHKDARVLILARWAARLREHYIEIGHDLGHELADGG